MSDSFAKLEQAHQSFLSRVHSATLRDLLDYLEFIRQEVQAHGGDLSDPRWQVVEGYLVTSGDGDIEQQVQEEIAQVQALIAQHGHKLLK